MKQLFIIVCLSIVYTSILAQSINFSSEIEVNSEIKNLKKIKNLGENGFLYYDAFTRKNSKFIKLIRYDKELNEQYNNEIEIGKNYALKRSTHNDQNVSFVFYNNKFIVLKYNIQSNKYDLTEFDDIDKKNDLNAILSDDVNLISFNRVNYANKIKYTVSNFNSEESNSYSFDKNDIDFDKYKISRYFLSKDNFSLLLMPRNRYKDDNSAIYSLKYGFNGKKISETKIYEQADKYLTSLSQKKNETNSEESIVFGQYISMKDPTGVFLGKGDIYSEIKDFTYIPVTKLNLDAFKTLSLYRKSKNSSKMRKLGANWDILNLQTPIKYKDGYLVYGEVFYKKVPLPRSDYEPRNSVDQTYYTCLNGFLLRLDKNFEIVWNQKFDLKQSWRGSYKKKFIHADLDNQDKIHLTYIVQNKLKHVVFDEQGNEVSTYISDNAIVPFNRAAIETEEQVGLIKFSKNDYALYFNKNEKNKIRKFKLPNFEESDYTANKTRLDKSNIQNKNKVNNYKETKIQEQIIAIQEEIEKLNIEEVDMDDLADLPEEKLMEQLKLIELKEKLHALKNKIREAD